MAVLKCKMCGGDLGITEGLSVAECEYCGTKQAVPKVIDENLQNLFNRANILRIKGEFDKAEEYYSAYANYDQIKDYEKKIEEIEKDKDLDADEKAQRIDALKSKMADNGIDIAGALEIVNSTEFKNYKEKI